MHGYLFALAMCLCLYHLFRILKAIYIYSKINKFDNIERILNICALDNFDYDFNFTHMSELDHGEE